MDWENLKTDNKETQQEPDPEVSRILLNHLIRTISETNGISLVDTLELLLSGDLQAESPKAFRWVQDFNKLVSLFSQDEASIHQLLDHPVSQALGQFFRFFPVKFSDEHIHLTGSITSEFIFPRLMSLFEGPHRDLYKRKIIEVYGPSAWPIQSVQDLDRLIHLPQGEGFDTYLRILYLPKLILVDRQSHADSAYHVATELYHRHNVGRVRLKFSLSRASTKSEDQVPGSDLVSQEDVVLGLYDGFKKFQQEHPEFKFILSPSFRKEADFFDAKKYSSRRDHFESQVEEIIRLIKTYPFLVDHLKEVDTVGNENDLYRKEHFNEFKKGFRKLRYYGFQIRSHHGETFHTLKKGIQAVDNAMNIWNIDALEHGLSLGINPNVYFHRLYQSVIDQNRRGIPIQGPKSIENQKTSGSSLYKELIDLDWGSHREVLEKLLRGIPLNEQEHITFIKSKFHTAREVEHYQHDVINRMLQKETALVSLPSSNNKLTGQFEDYKDHPFSWWEKKGLLLGVGTDNYVTLGTNYIQEMLIILYTDPVALKITKLLMVTSLEQRRPYMSHLLWQMRERIS